MSEPRQIPAVDYHIERALEMLEKKFIDEGHVGIATVHGLLAIATAMQERNRRPKAEDLSDAQCDAFLRTIYDAAENQRVAGFGPLRYAGEGNPIRTEFRAAVRRGIAELGGAQ